MTNLEARALLSARNLQDAKPEHVYQALLAFHHDGVSEGLRRARALSADHLGRYGVLHAAKSADIDALIAKHEKGEV